MKKYKTVTLSMDTIEELDKIRKKYSYLKSYDSIIKFLLEKYLEREKRKEEKITSKSKVSIVDEIIDELIREGITDSRHPRFAVYVEKLARAKGLMGSKYIEDLTKTIAERLKYLSQHY